MPTIESRVRYDSWYDECTHLNRATAYILQERGVV